MDTPYQSITHFTAANPSFRPGGIKALIHHEKTNGLKESGAIIRIGRKKILINVEKFFSWVEAQNVKKEEA